MGLVVLGIPVTVDQARTLFPVDNWVYVVERSKPALVIGYTVARNADVAQLVEHHLAKVRVAGSNPVVRSKQSSGHSLQEVLERVSLSLF